MLLPYFSEYPTHSHTLTRDTRNRMNIRVLVIKRFALSKIPFVITKRISFPAFLFFKKLTRMVLLKDLKF